MSLRDFASQSNRRKIAAFSNQNVQSFAAEIAEIIRKSLKKPQKIAAMLLGAE